MSVLFFVREMRVGIDVMMSWCALLREVVGTLMENYGRCVAAQDGTVVSVSEMEKRVCALSCLTHRWFASSAVAWLAWLFDGLAVGVATGCGTLTDFT